ncbi:MAG: hypothetical protein ACR2PI_00900 [Hyphomicrobiaceae bacterium]
MFLVRLLVLAVAVIMLLPADPASREAQRAYQDGRSVGFCSRYPKTCDASGEVWSAFKRKLAYAIKLARQSLAAQSDPYYERYASPKLGGRLGEWRAPARAPPSRYDSDIASPDDRSFALPNDR